MENIKSIISIISIIWAILILFYVIYVRKRQRQYKQDIEAFGLEYPDEIVPKEEVAKLFKEFISINVKPYKILGILLIIGALLSISLIVLRK